MRHRARLRCSPSPETGLLAREKTKGCAGEDEAGRGVGLHGDEAGKDTLEQRDVEGPAHEHEASEEDGARAAGLGEGADGGRPGARAFGHGRGLG